MSIVFAGLLYDDNLEIELLESSKSGLQAAPNQYQWGLIRGIQGCCEEKISIISSWPIGAFPKNNRRLFIPSFDQKAQKNIKISYIGFINLYLVRDLIRSQSFYKKIRQEIKVNGCKILIVYNLEICFVFALKRLKKQFGENLKIIIVVPDLPGRLGVLRKLYTPEGIWDRLFVKKRMNMLLYADALVLLTEQMKDVLGWHTKPYCVVEGFVAEEELKRGASITEKSPKVVLYSGSLNPTFGIVDLIEAFKNINGNYYRLWICGSGSGIDYVKKQASLDRRILYWGYLGRNKLTYLQQMATVMINPRQARGEYNKYSFPSKTLEYIASGKPVIMYPLPGIPAEYFEYVFCVEGSKIQDLTKKIIDVCEMDQKTLEEFGDRARNWLLTKKSNISQAAKVIEMISTF